jgi:transposase
MYLISRRFLAGRVLGCIDTKSATVPSGCGSGYGVSHGSRVLICPACGDRIREVHDVREREVRDLPWGEYRTTVVVEIQGAVAGVRNPGGAGRATAEHSALQQTLRRRHGPGVRASLAEDGFRQRGTDFTRITHKNVEAMLYRGQTLHSCSSLILSSDTTFFAAPYGKA